MPRMPPLDVFLVRHAESEWNAVGRWQGQADPALSSGGVEQAERLARSFPQEYAGARLFSSDLQRARETARPLADRLGVEVVLDARLRELDVGSWSGYTREEVGARDPRSLALYFEGKVGWEGGESYVEHEARAADFVDSIDEVDGDQPIVVVTHGGTLRALLIAALQLDPSTRWRLTGIGHTSVTWLRRGAHGWCLCAFNASADGLPPQKSGAIL